MRVLGYRGLMVLLVCIFMFTTACANNNGQAVRNQDRQNLQQLNLQQQSGHSSDVAVIPLTNHNGASFVSLDELVNVLEFNSEWEQDIQTYSIGDNDVVYRVKMNSNQAEKEEEAVQLADKPILLEGKKMLPLEALNLFQEYMNYEISNGELVVFPNYTDVNADVGEDFNFADDPSDPKGMNDDFEGEALDIEDISPSDQEVWATGNADESTAVFTRKEVDANRLIATGKKYMGVKYKFGAKKYAQTKRFDCSSFVQQLYNTYGVRLPRTARSQAKYGLSISRKNLRKGDLLYFYVPGRFKTNSTVGHVGIYIGSNKMLHSSPIPEDGVQITDINKSYWKKTYLGAKRVLK